MSNKNPILDPDSRMVSGPVNVIRLEGSVHGIKKVIYLFLDYHLGLNSQTQCSNIFSEDVQKYFTHSFYKLNEGNKIYDFFLEVYPSEVASKEYRKDIAKSEGKEKYIEEVVKLFRKIFEYDSKKNKVSINKLFKNVRLHYLDIRDYYKGKFHEKLSEMVTIANKFTKMDYIDVKGLERIIDLMEMMKQHLELVVDILSKKSRKISKKTIIRENVRSGTIDAESLEYLANKIKNLYKYPDVKNAMNDLISLSIDNFEKTINDIDNAIDDFNLYADKISVGDKLIKDPNTSYVFSYGLSPYTIREMAVDIYNRVEKLLDENFVEFFARFTDIYFLRRFLDKDYITNAIVYSGALHSNTYINVLVKLFGFRVTHLSYSKIKNLDKLNSEIKKRPLMEIQELILPEYLDQCSDMNSFPREFL